uniref:Lysosomal protein transmembrane 5 n=1 Tax=Equus caballus TaxID=9796 RepID=F7DWJ3_HORSE
MAPSSVRQTCCCFNVRIATTALAIYHVIMSVLLFIEHSVEVAHGKASCKLSQTGYLRIADLTSSFLLIIMLFVISLSLLIGVVKNREKYLLPFLSLQIMDFLLCLLTLLGSYIELPAYLKFASHSSRAGPSKVPLMTLKLLDFCLSILTLCSSYMEVPTYLNFKSMNHMVSLGRATAILRSVTPARPQPWRCEGRSCLAIRFFALGPLRPGCTARLTSGPSACVPLAGLLFLRDLGDARHWVNPFG